ncbi:BAR domain-containing protein [Clostridium felsineum]|uniref:hypothetical protein n=1 Tax=Clostridium felsineum TaxID=36839 RepID=UPI0011155D4D|nr:hypothetical protein [Clostridium felsineum]
MKINNIVINIPSYYSLNAEIKYFDLYEKYKDYRKSFCGLILEMIKEKDNINIKNVEVITDDELIKVIKIYLENYEELKINFEQCFNGNYFETFYVANKKIVDSSINVIPEELKKINEQMKDCFDPMIKSIANMQNITSPILKNNYISKSFPEDKERDVVKVESIHKEIKNKLFNEDLLKIENPQITTNNLISQLNNNIESSKENEKNYQLQNNEYSKQMIELLIKQEEFREVSERKAVKNDRRTFGINIVIVIMTFLSLICSIVGIALQFKK